MSNCSRSHSLIEASTMKVRSTNRRPVTMQISRLRWRVMRLGGMVLVTGMIMAQQTRRVDDSALNNDEKGADWVTYGRTYSEQRYSPLKQIDTTNVGSLGLAWSYEVGPGGG